MKVFEVTTEHTSADNNEIVKTVLYVTAESNTLIDVVDYFTRHCLEYEKDLIGVREILVVVEHIKKPECSFEEYMKMYENEDDT
jgi:hypothetical protein